MCKGELTFNDTPRVTQCTLTYLVIASDKHLVSKSKPSIISKGLTYGQYLFGIAIFFGNISGTTQFEMLRYCLFVFFWPFMCVLVDRD